jgi:hypothetical protein
VALKSLDVFSLRDSVVGEYKKFATSFTTIHADDIRQQVEAIYALERYWPEPLIQIIESVIQALAGLWVVRVRLIAALALIAGLFLAASGFITNWMLSERPVGESGW